MSLRKAMLGVIEIDRTNKDLKKNSMFHLYQWSGPLPNHHYGHFCVQLQVLTERFVRRAFSIALGNCDIQRVMGECADHLVLSTTR